MVSRLDSQSPTVPTTRPLASDPAPVTTPPAPATTADNPIAGWLPSAPRTNSATRTVDLRGGATLTGSGTATTSASGVDSATATAAFKALLGGTSIDTTGTGLTITNNSLTKAQFQAALSTVLGSGAKLSQNGTFAYSPSSGVDSKLVAAFKSASQGLTIGTDDALQVKQGQASGTLAANVSTVLGNDTVLSQGKVVLKDNALASAELATELKAKFGASASLDGTVKASLDSSGLRGVEATAALKTLLGHSTIDTSGSGLTITNHGLSQAHFEAAVQTLLGPNAQLNNHGAFSWNKNSAVSADLVSDFKAAAGNLTISGDGNLTLKNGQRSGQLEASLKDVLGTNVVVSNNALTFKDNHFVSAQLDQSLTSKFGPAASLAATFSTTATAKGLETATATAAYKALLGSTSIDTSGTGLTIKNNSLDSAKFQTALATVLGPTATLNNDGSFTWSKESGVSADLVSAFKQTTDSLTLAADGRLTLKDGKASGALGAQLQKVLGDNVLIADNQVLFKDNAFQSASLNEELKSKFGATASLDTTLSASVEAGQLRSAQLTAAYKALVGSSRIDTTGTGLTITNHGLGEAQFKAAVQTVFGENAQLSNTGTFAWYKGSGVSADLVSSFKAVRGSLNLAADGTLQVKNGKASGLLSEQLQDVLGSNTLIANNQVVFKDSAFQSATLDEQLQSTFGPKASLASTLQASLDASGVKTATATAALELLVGNTSIDTSGTGLTITNNSLDQAGFKAALHTLFGPNASLDNRGAFVWDKKSGVSADLVSSFKATANNLTIGGDGSLQVLKGKASGQLETQLQAVLGSNTLISDNQVVFKDNAFQSAALDEQLKSTLGPKASLDTTLKASLDRSGVACATATAAFKTLLGNSTIDTSGTGLTIKNNGLQSAQFQAAVQTLLGSGATFGNDGSFTWTKDSGVSAKLVSDFKSASKAVSVGTDGTLTVQKGKASGALAAQLSAILGSNTLVSNGQVLFKDNHFDAAKVKADVDHRFGPASNLDATVEASLDAKGVQSATVLAAYKTLLGGTTIDTTGTGLTIKNNRLDDVQFRTAVQTVFGPNATLANNATYEWSKDSGVTASLASAYKATVGATTINADGTLGLKAGQLSGALEAQLKTVLGANTLVADNTVIFEQGKFKSVGLDDSLTRQWGKDASITSTLKATVTQDGLADATVGLAAFKRLKTLGADGAIDVKADGTVVIKNDQVDRAEVSALLSVMSGQPVNLTTGGKLVYANGKVDPSFNANLGAAWGATSLDGAGTLTLVDGKPEVEAKVSALFGGTTVKSGAAIEVHGSSAKVDLKLAELGAKSKLDSTGSLVLDHGRVTGAGLTTNLVTTGSTPAELSMSGLISVTDAKAEASLKAQASAGKLSGALGIGGASTVQVYSPTDPARLAVQRAGGVWAQRDASFQLNANAGVSTPVQVGAATVQLGVKADANQTRAVHALTVHASKDDALASGPLTVLHPPATVDDVLAMRPYEQFSDVGTRSLGLGGNVSVGYGIGPASVSAGGSVYYQVTSNVERDLERLDGSSVRLRFRKGEGKSDVKTVSAGVGLSAGKLGTGALAAKAAPIVAQVAKVGLSASLDSSKQHDTLFDVTIDTSTPQGKAALQHALSGELSEAQYWAGFKGSGVTLNSQLTTDVTAQSRKLDLDVGTLNKEDMSRWLDKQQRLTTASQFTFAQAVDQTRKTSALLPWNADRTSDMRFVHESTKVDDRPLPDVSTGGAVNDGLQARVGSAQPIAGPTLADSQAVLGVRVKVTDPKTSLSDMKHTVDPMIDVLRTVGFAPAEYKKLAAFRAALDAGLAPQKKALIPVFGGIGDQRFGSSTVDLEGYIGPKAFGAIFQPGGSPRSGGEFQRAYLENSGTVLSTAGTQAAIARGLGATLTPGPGGTFEVMKKGKHLGTLTSADLERVRQDFMQVARAPRDQNGEPNPNESAIDFRVGQWTGSHPNLLRLEPGEHDAAYQALSTSQVFAETMQEAGALYAANQPPARGLTEPDAAYQTRLDAWKKSSLFTQPDLFFSQLDALFQREVSADKTQTSAVTMLQLAGPDGILGHAQLDVQPAALETMVATGRANVQRFGAVQVLSSLGATVDAAGNLVFAKPPANPDQALAAAKVLFGASAKLAPQGSLTALRDLTWPSTDFRSGLTTLLASAKGQPGSMTLPADWTPAQSQKVLGQVFGSTATLQGSAITFDNRGYGLIHLGEALSIFGDAFGAHATGAPPPLFPTLTPVTDEGKSQAALSTGLIAKHQGAGSASWSKNFGRLEMLKGSGEDLGKTKASSPNDWILK